LPSVLLELGGQSSTIIGPDAKTRRRHGRRHSGEALANSERRDKIHRPKPDACATRRTIGLYHSAASAPPVAAACSKGDISPHFACIVNNHHALRLERFARLHGLRGDAIVKGAEYARPLYTANLAVGASQSAKTAFL
jgi:hypothetical protein